MDLNLLLQLSFSVPTTPLVGCLPLLQLRHQPIQSFYLFQVTLGQAEPATRLLAIHPLPYAPPAIIRVLLVLIPIVLVLPTAEAIHLILIDFLLVYFVTQKEVVPTLIHYLGLEPLPNFLLNSSLLLSL